MATTYFTSVGDTFIEGSDVNENDFTEFVTRMRRNYDLQEGISPILTHHTPLPIVSRLKNFKAGIYGEALCLNIKGELITLSLKDDMAELTAFIEDVKREIQK